MFKKKLNNINKNFFLLSPKNNIKKFYKIKNMKLPFIEGYSDNSVHKFNSSDQRDLNNFKAFKENHFCNIILNNFGKERKPIKFINLRKKDLKEKLKKISSVSDIETKSINKKNINSIKMIKLGKRKSILNSLKSDISDNRLDKNLNNNDDYFQDLIISKSTIVNNRNNKKLILPIASNKLNNYKIFNNIEDESKKENSCKYIFNGVKEKAKKNTIHEYDIKFNNSFLKNINWNNNLLKKIFKSKKIILNMEIIKDYKIKKKSESKEKETKEKSILKNINSINNYDNSYFNSEINNFYNNCKMKNNKLILSMVKKNDSIKSYKKIYIDRFNDNNKNSNFFPSKIIHNNFPKNENKRNILLYQKNKSNSSNVSFNSKYKI